MSKPNLIQNAQAFMTKHSPEILTGMGIAGMITTTVLAVKATPKALRLLDEKKREENVDKLTPIETIKTAWKCYIPAAVTGAVSTACLIGASKVNLTRNAALATAYKLSETALAEYREKVVETIGEKKEKAVREQVAKDRVKDNPVSQNVIYTTEKGDTLFLDPVSHRYFKSDIEDIKKAVNVLNKNMLCDIFGYVSLNEFYDEIGLERTSIGDEIGWKLEDGRGLINIDFVPEMADNGKPCLSMDYSVAPKYGFDDYYSS